MTEYSFADSDELVRWLLGGKAPALFGSEEEAQTVISTLESVDGLAVKVANNELWVVQDSLGRYLVRHTTDV